MKVEVINRDGIISNILPKNELSLQ